MSSFGIQWGTLLDAWMCDCWKCLSPFSLYVCADFLFHLIVFSNVCTLRKWRRKFFAIFLALTLTPHTHSTSIHSCWWCTCAAFCTVITSTFFFFLFFILLLLSSTKLNKGDRAKVFLVVAMTVHCMCDSKCVCLSFFARYSSSAFIHLSWLYNSLVVCVSAVCVCTSIHINARFNIGY